MNIKICGIRRKEDLSTCLKAGADLMGFINIKRSKRMVEIQDIKELTSFMKDKTKAVLVIEPKNMADAKERIDKTGLKNIQLHSLSAGEIDRLKKDYQLNRATEENQQIREEHMIEDNNGDLTVTRALGLSEVMYPEKIKEIQDFANICDYILFDYEVKGKTGGTGRCIPTKTAIEAAKIAKDVNSNLKLFLAGGMDKKRIEEESETLEKFFDFVDVNSGVEDEPGVKNAAKIMELMKIKELKN
nr:phosphoribosylanthranilate isomerase [uncultured Methanobacterium sp.]